MKGIFSIKPTLGNCVSCERYFEHGGVLNSEKGNFLTLGQRSGSMDKGASASLLIESSSKISQNCVSFPKEDFLNYSSAISRNKNDGD